MLFKIEVVMNRIFAPLLALCLMAGASNALAQESTSDLTSSAIVKIDELVHDVHLLARDLAAIKDTKERRSYYESKREKLVERASILMEIASEAYLIGTLHGDHLRQIDDALNRGFEDNLKGV